ncbi:MAG TPA: hypothetical protein VIM87_09340 [Chitinophaga sp.]|uniref:hypothetical protein n=1 Tax=Chitinophaga sp. TaxID=1869181 RepID=UPI002F934085
MDAETLINNFKKSLTFSDKDIIAIQTDNTLRAGLISFFRSHHDRNFSLTLLDKLIELRREPRHEISIDDLMLASFIIGMHGQVEDCLKVWKAKRVDFDTYCGVDIQLIPFAGVDKTITFLRTQTDNEAKKALEYILACSEAGDFDDLDEYYNQTPWWV